MKTSNKQLIDAKNEVHLIRLYWLIRASLTFIWIWTAFVSFFIFPHAESINWLQRLGFENQSNILLLSACIFDLALGIATIFLPSKKLWYLQMLLISVYSIIIIFGLPEFLTHPFGPITKNIAVLSCLYFLVILEDARKKMKLEIPSK